MLSSHSLIAALLAATATPAAAHLIMSKPVPYNLAGAAPLVQTSPLGPNFPFPAQGLSRVVEMNNATAGGVVEVSFTGSAMHKGGSCQFALQLGDTPSADPKQWKVITSVIGGCPGESDGPGNLPDTGVTDAEGRPTGKVCSSFSEKECTKTFRVPIPKGVPSGRYSFSWTWFNYIGNREMYHNAAPLTVTGGADAAAGKTFLDSLPSIFVANVAGFSGSTCNTGNGILSFPEPGDVGMVIEAPTANSNGACPAGPASPKFATDITALQSGAAAVPAAPAVPGTPGSSSTGAPAASSSAATTTTGSPAATSPATGTSPTSTVPGGVFIQPPPSSAVPTTLSTVVRPTATAAAPAAPPASSTPPAAAPAGKVACSGSALICIGTGQFGLCDNGFAIPQQLAPGTTCVDGKVAKR